MAIPKQCDVVVIGGGPAGSVVAALLRQKQYDVVLLERKKHPRYAVGESLIPHFWKYCDAIGVGDAIRAEGFVRKSGGTLVWHNVIRQLAFRDFGYTEPALHVERDRFDQILLEHARHSGVQIFEEVSVSSVDLDGGERPRVMYRTPDGAETGEVACRFVVDASGQGALIAKQLGTRVIDEGFRFMSVWGYFDGGKYVAGDGRAYDIEHLGTVLPQTFVSSVGGLGEWGWAWHIPLRKSTSVGLVLPVEHLKKIKATDEGLREYFLRKCSEIPYLGRLLEQARLIDGSIHMVRDYSYRSAQLAGPGFFLIGDAAAFIDPIFSIGVVMGMYSASVAVWAIDHSFRNPRQTTRNQAIFASQFRARLEVSRSLALPRYRGIGEAADLARQAIQFESLMEQELMYVVSVVTTRTDNFHEIAERRDGQKLVSTRFRELQDIVF